MGLKKVIQVIRTRGILRVILGILSLGVLSLGLLGLRCLTGRIYPGVNAGSLYLGGLTLEEGRRVLIREALEEATRPVKLIWGDRVLITTYGALGVTLDVEATLARAWAVGRNGSWRQRLGFLWPGRRYEVEVVYRYDKDKALIELEHLVGALRQNPQDASLKVDSKGKIQVVPAREGWIVDIEELWAMLKTPTPWSSGESIKIPVTKLMSAVTTEEIVRRGITKPVASYRTLFNPAEENRAHNIRLAAQALDGIWMAPGAEISFNEIVGPRTPERGYVEALVIESLEFAPGVGGGVCQVSTTLYNAALRAGLTVVERQPHGLSVSYVPPGLDATVAYGLIDLKLRNDTPYWFWLKAEVGEDYLAFTFYGPQQAPSIEVTTEVLKEIPPPCKIIEDAHLPLGRMIVEKKGQPGINVRVKRRWLNRGEIWEEVVSQDYYPPLPKVIRLGSGRLEQKLSTYLQQVPRSFSEGTTLQPDKSGHGPN
ncbi:Vancomycin resistance protein YoaR, contains peptidoglycan-binding and VanW domains [Thermanaeromonas toyohensis ToBE]|uniref:Vancomycin resistance protein YoaR, contains peptidoglycan-binding and VanW domains n=2 Tax=Thermanaeromonas TaxID=202949 RepID=A0A1W1W0R9_9FIRM|nr:Vancomycin resistance protein YoaR, contains peptidoglycan-binding and VanW domains [Thermanaeromonas toyohensis ToBE]